MRTGIGIATAVVIWWSAAAAGFAQETTISLGVSSYDQTKAGLKLLVKDLPPANLRKQWENLEAVLDSFAQGVETTKPIQVDLILAKDSAHYVAMIPVAKLVGRGGFIDNVQEFSFTVSKPDASGIYTLEQKKASPRRAGGKKPVTPTGPPPKPYYMKHEFGYAFFAGDKAALQGKLVDPSPAMLQVLGPKVDVVALLQNDVATQEAKRKSFQELRKQWEAAIAFTRGETQAEFDLRKLSLTQNLNEAERFLIEADQLRFEWTTDTQVKRGIGALRLTGLTGSELLKSIQLINAKPSYFANVTFGEKAALQLRVNFPLDDLRTKHATDLYPATLAVLQEDMETRPNLTEAGKVKAKEALAKLFAMLNEAIPLQSLDTIIDVHATPDSKHGMVCGIRSADGTKATEILAMLPEIREGWKFEANTEEHAGVSIHKMQIAPHRMDEFTSLFGGEAIFYIGTSKDAVWGACGVDALTKLKAAIDQVGTPASENASPEFLSLEMRLEPWVKMIDLLRSKQPPSNSTDETEIELEKQRNKVRKYALSTFADCDSVLTAKLSKTGDEVTGSFDVSECLLKFVGTMIADYSAENLQ